MRHVPMILLGLVVGGMLGFGLSYFFAETSQHDYGPNAIPVGLLQLIVFSTIFGSILGATFLPIYVSRQRKQR